MEYCNDMENYAIKKGFTLFEMILVVAVVGLVATVSAPLGFQFYRGEMINSVQTQLVEVLSRAQSNAVTQKNDSKFGVYMAASTSPSYTLFQGSSYGAYPAFDELYDVPPDTTIVFPASTTAIIFAKHTGIPTNAAGNSATGTITIRRDLLTRTIIIDDFGNVSTP